MSRKTENIYRFIGELEGIQNQIALINTLAKTRTADDEEAKLQERHHLEKIEFEMAQNLKSLRFWIDSLYACNGRSKSRAKQNASKENGRKGGRPPKEITQARQRVQLIESELIPDFEQKKMLTVDPALEKEFTEKLEQVLAEKETLLKKIERWTEEKKEK